MQKIQAAKLRTSEVLECLGGDESTQSDEAEELELRDDPSADSKEEEKAAEVVTQIEAIEIASPDLSAIVAEKPSAEIRPETGT